MRLQPSRRSSSRRDSVSIGQALVCGVVAGVVATGIKTVCELISPPRPPGVESPLGNMLNAASVSATGKPMSQSLKSFAEPTVHFGFGAATAGLYAVVSERFPMLRAGRGSLFGVLFWLCLHETALPLSGLSPSPAAMSLWEQGNELVSHAAYGVTTELVRRGLVRKLA